MAGEYQLPLLYHDDSGSNTNNLKHGRTSSPYFSSDPIFSSDDDEPSSENYIQERHKKKIRGPWFSHRPTLTHDADHVSEKPHKTKRTFRRNFDSGVFMGSDSSEADIFSGRFQLTNTTPPKFPPKTHSSQDLVQQRIQLCLDEGNEVIDLSSLGLTSLENEAFKQLSSFIRVPIDTDGVFSILKPSLKIFLSSNQLKTLPCELFNLEHLQVLSLRGNLIHELSPKIGTLLNLKELNLSQNQLCYLPFEILTLFSKHGRLESLSLHPNMFYQPLFPIKKYGPNFESCNKADYSSNQNAEFNCHVFEDNSQIIWNDRWKASFQARTEVRFIDINGSLVKGPKSMACGSQVTQNSIPVANDDYNPSPPSLRGDSLSRVPSLLETALAACAKSPHLSYLELDLVDDTPPHLRDLLNLAISKQETCDSICTICGRKFIIARTEWIEWWEISSPCNPANMTYNSVQNNRDDLERMVPLIRRGCSWLCLPVKPGLER